MCGGSGDNSLALAMMQDNANRSRLQDSQFEYQKSRDAMSDRTAAFSLAEQLRQDAYTRMRDTNDRRNSLHEEAIQRQRDNKNQATAVSMQNRQNALQRQWQQQDRRYQDSRDDKNRLLEQQAANRADAKELKKKNLWTQDKNNVFEAKKNDYLQQLADQGIDDPAVKAALLSSLNSASASIPELATNPGGYFEGILDDVLSKQTTAAQGRYGKQLDAVLPQDYATTKINDTLDDSILEGILGDQYNQAASQAKRMLDRGVITREGYDANLRDLNTQRDGARSKLNVLGQNELASERTKLGDIANQGRQAASSAQLGTKFDPNVYLNRANQAYNDWFSNLGSTLKGVAPTDLFDTSNFANTAGSVSGPTNSPFMGTTNALTGVDASAISTDPMKKKQTAGTPSSAGVF